MSLKTQVAAEVKRRDLTITGAADAIGVTYPSIRAVLSGDSLPNARSLDKYAKFLGVDADKLFAQVEREKDRTGRRPGRPPGSGSKKSKSKKSKSKKKAAKKKSSKKKTAKKAGKKKTKKTAKKKSAKKKTAKAAAPKVDKRMLASLKASLKSVDQLRDKIESAIKRIEG